MPIQLATASAAHLSTCHRRARRCAYGNKQCAGAGAGRLGRTSRLNGEEDNPQARSLQESMPPFLFRSPNTSRTVHGFIAEQLPGDAYETITCLACRKVHYVNPTTGKVLGEDQRE